MPLPTIPPVYGNGMERSEKFFWFFLFTKRTPVLLAIATARQTAHAGAMRIIETTNDPVRLSFVAALLRDAGIDSLVLDNHTSAVEGSIGAIPRRLAVASSDEAEAKQVMREAGLG